MEMLAALIGLFVPLQIGRCPVGRLVLRENRLAGCALSLTITDLPLLIAGQSKAT